MMARSTRSNQRSDTLMRDRTAGSTKTSCTARPDHTLGSFASFWPRASHFRSSPRQPTCGRRLDFVGKGQNQTSRCELIHIPIDLSCASLLSYVRGRPVSWESRWRLTRQATQFHLSSQRHDPLAERWLQPGLARFRLHLATGVRRDTCV